MLGQLRQTKAVGPLVINLQALLSSDVGSPMDIVREDGDQVLIESQKQEVTVIGEVQSATSHLYSPGLGRDD